MPRPAPRDRESVESSHDMFLWVPISDGIRTIKLGATKTFQWSPKTEITAIEL